MTRDEAVQEAKRYLSDPDYNIEDIKSLIDILKSFFDFKLSRRVLKKASQNNPDSLWYKQQLALCTFKDEELPPADRFAKAIKILEDIDLRDPENINSETLSLGGSVFKRLWEYNNQIENLIEALSFFRSAYERNPQTDMGYSGVNAAYILQLLAYQMSVVSFKNSEKPKEAEVFEENAMELRKKVVTEMEDIYKKNPSMKDNGFFLTTLAEAYLGLKDYDMADNYLSRWRTLNVSEWERQTTFRQLANIVKLQNIKPPKDGESPEQWERAWQVVANATGKWSKNALCSSLDRVGLALSGGGFRASLYHLGVMARLAEADVLRSVEVLSTVSGGSILGAYYYLELKNLLETKMDGEIGPKDYIEIIKRIQKSFLLGIQQNIRTRTLTNLGKNLKMMFSKDYGRSNRLGELYEDILYSRIEDNHDKSSPRYMKDLLIQPKGEEKGFNPKFLNWRRRSKVPILLINSTSLNTGHAWQFTARSMGEPPGLLGSEVDRNSRYRRFWYEEAPNDYAKNYRLGLAVAASACVPGLFDPLCLDGLYRDKTVSLVDGGVYDNQGIEGLLSEACNFVFCSDASGQMEDIDMPSRGFFSVLLRSNSILMDRVRESEYQNVRAHRESHAIRGLFFVHLKKDLKIRLQDWLKCDDPTPVTEQDHDLTAYGINPDIQRLLSNIRTDLDTFTETEAYALMCSGYLMAEEQLKRLHEEYKKKGGQGTWGGFNPDAPREKWDFLEIEPFLKLDKKSNPVRKDLEKQLRVSALKVFKIWRLDWRLKFLSFLMVILAIFSAYYSFDYIKPLLNEVLFSLTFTLKNLFILLGIILIIILLFTRKIISPETIGISLPYKVFIALFGFLASNIHIIFFNRMFINRGRIKRLIKKHIKYLVKMSRVSKG